jgi:hypothetical protein
MLHVSSVLQQTNLAMPASTTTNGADTANVNMSNDTGMFYSSLAVLRSYLGRALSQPRYKAVLTRCLWLCDRFQTCQCLSGSENR